MTESIARQPKGIPVGGQFAPTAHSEPEARLASINIDQFNHGVQPLRVEGASSDLTDELAAAGLTGSLVRYTGGNPDIEDGAWAYTSNSNRDLVLSRTGDGGFVVHHDDRYDEDSFHLETTPEDSTPESNVESVRRALWDLAVADANYTSPTQLATGDFYELREVTLDRNGQGQAYAAVMASNDDGMWTTVTQNYSTGAVGIERDGTRLTGPAAELELAALFEGLGSEPLNGDFHAHVRSVFSNLLTTATADPDAPRWAKELSDQRHTSNNELSVHLESPSSPGR